MMNTFKRILFLAALSLMLVSCNTAASLLAPTVTSTPEDTPDDSLAAVHQEPAIPSSTPTATTAITETPTEAPVDETPTPTPLEQTASPIPMPELGFEPGDPELYASTLGEFERAAGKPQMVELFAFWWGTCQTMAPVVHGLEDKYGEFMNFVYVDVDNPQVGELILELEVYSNFIPTFLFLNSEGELTGDVFIGGRSPQVMEQAVIDVLVAEGIFSED